MKIELPLETSIPQTSLVRSPKRQSIALQWFSNLPVRGKQLTGLFTSEIISIVGLVGVGAVLIVAAGRTQLLRQAEAELAVATTNYNTKIDQMSVGFRSQSDNAAVIAAAKIHVKGQTLTPDLQAQVKHILRSELEANQIEYATLVGKDLQIIVNANTNRSGETFDPNNLVSEVFKNPQQIKASQIVTWAELTKESPPLPTGFTKQDALIRYTITPVKDPETGKAIAALVAGDIVNGKLPIMENTLSAFGGGYSAIYTRNASGKFTLATALDQGRTTSLKQAQYGVPLVDTSILDKAVATPGTTVTSREVAGTQSYTMAAKALTDFSGKPIAVLVRGTQETALNKLLGESLLVQLMISGLTLAVDVMLAMLLGRTIAQPLKNLQQTAKQFASGDRTVRAEASATDEVGELAQTFNELAESVVLGEASLAEQARRQLAEADRLRLYAKFTSSIYKSLHSTDILRNSAEGVRIVLQTDRVLLYRFNPDWRSGTVVAESVAHGWAKAMGQTIHDPLVPGSVERFRSGQIWTCNNVDEAVLSDCHCQILKRLQVKANMIAPVLQNGELVALLCVHQCSSSRNWQDEEIDIFRQLSAQISFALNQAHLLEQLEGSRQEAEQARTKAELVSQQVEQARQKAEWVSEEQRLQKEALQRQVVELLGDIEDSARGNLTVRARVTESTIGTVADFFNAIIENLREIVTQVQLASSQVHTSLREDERAVSQLAEQAIAQTEEITRTLDSVEQMAHSIEGVARNASQAASVARTAATAAEVGGAAIDSTVTNILNLQTTVVKTVDKVKLLGESSKQIAKVVSLVQGIALQTNLLAINAGIEASRAGEEGQGFRVVAEQIGDLATQVANATRDIEQVIETIEQATQDVTVAMEQGRTQVVNSTRMVIDAKQSLEQIFEVSHEIDSLVQSISGATVTQAQTSGMVKELMQEIAKTSQYTSESSRQVSSSLQQTVEVAQQLQLSVGRFKIDD